MRKLLLCVLCLAVNWGKPVYSDEPSFLRGPGYGERPNVRFPASDSYESATRFWKTPEDIAAWIEGNFVYDKGRAVVFSETRRRGEGEAHVYTPSEFFRIKRGVCVDLARFAVETLKVVDPATNPKYVMIEFEPVRIGEDILRFHWLVSFRREGKAYFFADSERPGYVVGSIQ